MIDKLIYYVELVSALCGFDGSDDYQLTGMILVFIAFSAVVYAFYLAIVKLIWPQEEDESHIKYNILDDELGSD